MAAYGAIEIAMEFIALIIAKAPEIISALFAIHAGALAVVNLTPTPKDDEVVAKYYRVIEVLAGVVTKVAKK